MTFRNISNRYKLFCIATCLFFILVYDISLVGQTLVIPHAIDDKVAGKDIQQGIDFYQYPYVSEKIDLRVFKKTYPNLEAPDFITVKAPDLSEFQTVTVLLGLLNGLKADSNAVVIWFAGNYFSEEVTFFVDVMMDRNYLNDGPPIVVKIGQNPVPTVIYPAGYHHKGLQLSLQVPKKLKFKNFGALSNRKYKITNQLSIGLHVGFGSGSLNYQYDNLEKGFPTWYTVNNAEKNIGLSLSYSLLRFRIGLSTTLQNHFYYTSYLNIRFDHPVIRVDPNTGQRVKIDNIQIERNQDIHGKNRIQWALNVAYRMHLGETTELQPTIGMGKTTHLSGEYVADYTGDQEVYKLPASSFMEGGVLFEFTTGAHKAFFIGMTYNKIWWKPKGFLENIPHENLKTNFKTWKGHLGYRIGL